MRTPELEPKLQTCIRKHFANYKWDDLANALGITSKSVHYNLDEKLGRSVTFHFIGLVAVFFPISWQEIMFDFINGGQ